MRHCVTDAVHASPEQGNEKLAEVNPAVALAHRLYVHSRRPSGNSARRYGVRLELD